MVNRYQCLHLYAWFLLLVHCHSALLKFQWMKSIQLYSRSNAQNIPCFSEPPQSTHKKCIILYLWSSFNVWGINVYSITVNHLVFLIHNCNSLPFFYCLNFEKGRLPYIHRVGWLVGRLVGWLVGRLVGVTIIFFSIYTGIKALY